MQCQAPTIFDAIPATKKLKELLFPRRQTGNGYKHFSKDPLDPYVRSHLNILYTFLNLYTDADSPAFCEWGRASALAALTIGTKTLHYDRKIRRMGRAWICEGEIPENPFGDWNESLLADEALLSDVQLFLQSLGNQITAEKLAAFLADPEVMVRHGIKKQISVRTARRYLRFMDYRFAYEKEGQYADGHERPDVTAYRDKVFIPWLHSLVPRMHLWVRNGIRETGPLAPGKQIIVWYHDESIFYANDRRRKFWWQVDAAAKPYQKGEGQSFMIADYVSAEFGWLRARDGRSARR
ncbi:hypothetical protein DL96DRAFT_1475542, partial [Flagelloscypha sp. PMI_526]